MFDKETNSLFTLSEWVDVKNARQAEALGDRSSPHEASLRHYNESDQCWEDG